MQNRVGRRACCWLTYWHSPILSRYLPPASCSAYSQAQSKFLFRPLDKLHSKRRQREPEVVYELIGARERYGDHDGGARPGGTQFTDKPVACLAHACRVSADVEQMVRVYTSAFYLFQRNLLEEARAE